MRYLIDGYNLLHAIGLARKAGGRAAWDRSRILLLDWLADQHGDQSADVTVVFDAQNAFGGLIEEKHRGLRIVRHGGRTADDVIEELLRSERSPETLTVVSNDNRVRDSAGRRGARVEKCVEHVDRLVGHREAPVAPTPPADEKDVVSTDEERAEWLRTFGGGGP
jgi:predicted RNA-binding protein with PIN domain